IEEQPEQERCRDERPAGGDQGRGGQSGGVGEQVGDDARSDDDGVACEKTRPAGRESCEGPAVPSDVEQALPDPCEDEQGSEVSRSQRSTPRDQARVRRRLKANEPKE